MRFLLITALILINLLGTAQTKDETAIMAVINNVFEAMRTSDSTLLKNCFVENPSTFTVTRTPEGETRFLSGDFQRFINGVGTPKDKVWDEPIWNEKIEIDDDLASVWVDYAFYHGGQFSHCGVDAFQLVRLNGTWKIFHLADTRRREGCYIPDEVKR